MSWTHMILPRSFVSKFFSAKLTLEFWANTTRINHMKPKILFAIHTFKHLTTTVRTECWIIFTPKIEWFYCDIFWKYKMSLHYFYKKGHMLTQILLITKLHHLLIYKSIFIKCKFSEHAWLSVISLNLFSPR